MKDLIILVADQDLEFTFRGLFQRHRSFGIRPLSFDIFIEPEHDPACCLRGIEFLEKFANDYRHALLVFDHEGCGQEQTERSQLQRNLAARFAQGPWKSQARPLILEPELESWVWSDSPHVDELTGWKNRSPGLRAWLRAKGFLSENEKKPNRPKEAFEAALREGRTPRSAAIYRQLAHKVSVERCIDATFSELKQILYDWFSVGND